MLEQQLMGYTGVFSSPRCDTEVCAGGVCMTGPTGVALFFLFFSFFFKERSQCVVNR